MHGNNLRLLPANVRLDHFLRFATLEAGIFAGLALLVAGIGGSIYAIILWQRADFGPQSPHDLMRVVVPSVTALTCGVQIIFAAFFLSVLRLGHRPSGVVASDD